jgi:hypothetical protein
MGLLLLCIISLSWAAYTPIKQPFYVCLDDQLDSTVQTRILDLLSQYHPTVLLNNDTTTATSGFVLSVGPNCAMGKGQLSLPSNVSEAYELKLFSPSASLDVLVTGGNPLQPAVFDIATNGGLVMSAFAALEQLGVGFFHPFEPFFPLLLSLDSGFSNVTERPHWLARGAHYHTEHPLDLTELLNGVDSVDKTWEEMLPEYVMYLSWLSAQKVNRLEWVILCDERSDWCLSANRTARMLQLTSTAHSFGIAVLADIGITIRQQHAMHMINNSSVTVPQMTADIHTYVDWALAQCGFNGISTEAGTSEFKHDACSETLVQYNILADYMTSTYPKTRLYIKEHISTGQTCKGYDSICHPEAEGIDFNFLPIYAHPGMGVMPHTVQFFTLDDPTLGSYGNANFSCLKTMALYSTQKADREVVFFPETTYWVDFDINVPSFQSPAYAYRAVYDARLFASQEATHGKLTGMM